MFLFAEGGHHTPIIVEFINHYLGEPVHKFQIEYTKPYLGKRFLNRSVQRRKLFLAVRIRLKMRFRGTR